MMRSDPASQDQELIFTKYSMDREVRKVDLHTPARQPSKDPVSVLLITRLRPLSLAA